MPIRERVYKATRVEFHELLSRQINQTLAPAPSFTSPGCGNRPRRTCGCGLMVEGADPGYPRASVRISPGLTICIVFASFAFRSEERGSSRPSRHANPRWMRPLAQESAF